VGGCNCRCWGSFIGHIKCSKNTANEILITASVFWDLLSVN
jgi:hypothetical protein